jgi:alpha-amylase/alpha-mannosidase (GH57 family)
MDKQLEKYYEERFSTMTTVGWKDFIEDTTNIFNAVNKVAPIQNELDLFFRKGQLDILQWVISLKESTEQAYEALQKDSSGDAQDDS